MIVVDEANELFQDLRDEPRVALEKTAVPNAYFHILQLDGRVVERCDSFAVISQ